MMTPLELLTNGREVITNKERWTRGALARDKNRDRTLPRSPKAVCFCSIGALLKANEGGFVLTVREAEMFLKQAMGADITIFNDRLAKNHDEVLSAWDKAIELARNDEAQAAA
jgi:hypothetical protein